LETIGKYRIIGGLGKGGFGQVYKAEDPTIGSVVAIKVLNVQNDEAMLRRFRAEAVTSAKLRHKNIVTIFDFEEQNGKPYLVMEYLDGENLQRLLETKERLPILDKLSIMAEVAEGLQYAHEHGVIHRDIKPANIMRLRDGSVKIMDFGIARLTQRNTRLTDVGYLVGTPEYMAPEQFMSDGTDSQCDVWSYGVVLYEFLTGHNPFSADSPGEVIYKVTHDDPPSIRERVRELPNGLDPVMRRLLAKKKAERYPSMEDLLLDLSPVIQEFGESQVAGMEKSAEGLIRAGKYDEALAVAARILKFDQKNTRARKWRADLRDLSRRQKEEARIKVLIEEADQKTTLLDFSAAEARLKEALQIDPANGSARSRLDQLNAVREKKLRAQNLLAEARVEFGQQNLTGAFEHATEAAQSDPASADASEFVRQVRKAIEKRDSEARRKAGLSKSRGMLLVQDYAGAVNTLQELAKQYPGDSEVRARLDEALHLQAVDATEKKAAAAIAKSRDYLVKGAFQDAIDLLAGLDPDAGRNVQVLQLLSYARDQREHQKREAEVEGLLTTATASQGDYERALGSIDRALELSPGNETALRLRKAVLANRQRDEENKAIEGELKECRSLMSADRLEHAETRARALWKRHPDHPGVQQIIRDLGECFRQREEALEREIESHKAELERLLDRGDVEAARERLKTVSARYQRDNLFADLSRRIARMETEKREQEAVNAILARAQRLGDGGYWDDARLAIDLGLKQFPRSAALLAQRERVLQQAELQTLVNEIQRQVALEDWESVVSAAESGLRKFPGDRRLTELLQTAREEREWQELLLQTENLILAGDLEEADKTIAELARRGRDNASVVRMLRMLGDKRQRQQSLASVDHFRKRFAFQQARDVLDTILKEDPNDASARALLEAVDREQSAYTRGQKVAAARAEAGRLSKQKEYAAAVRILTDLSNAYPGDFEIEEDLRHAALDQATLREAYSRGRNELAALVRNREFDQALHKAEELIASFPDDSELREEIRRVRAARDQAIRRQAYEEGRGEVAVLMKNQEFDRAIGRLQELAAAFPEEADVEDELRRARASREQAARKADYARGRKELEEFVRNRDFDRAVSAAERLSTAFPEEPELQDDLRRARAARDQAQRKNAYTRRREGFDALMADRQFDLAVNAVEGLSRDFPEESELRELLRHARETRDQARRKEAYSRGCQDFEVLMRDRKFDLAVTAAQSLIAAFPEEESSELLRRARKAREEAERKEQYARGCQDFEVLMRDRKFDLAVTAAQQLIKTFPEEQESAELLRDAQAARDLAGRKDAYSRDRQDFEALIRERQFDQAVTAARQLIEAFPEEQESVELLRRARKARDEAARKETYKRGCRDFEALMGEGKFDRAETAAQGLMAAFPKEPEAPRFLRRAQDAREEAARKEAYKRGCQNLEALMRDGEFEQAITAAQQLIQDFPKEPEAAELLRRAEEAVRKEAYKRDRQAFDVLMRDGEFEQAVAAAERLTAAYPEESEAPELARRAREARDEAARKEAYRRERQAFEVLMRDGKFEKAVAAAERLTTAYPEEADVPQLAHRAREARDEAARKAAYARGRQDFEALLANAQFEQAIAKAQELIAAFPAEPGAAKDLERARAAEAEAARKAAFDRGHKEFNTLMGKRQFDRAIAKAQELAAVFPKETILKDDLKRAVEAREQARRRQIYEPGRKEFDALLKSGRLEEAIKKAEALIKEFPEDAAVQQDLQSARGALEARQREAELDRQAAETVRRARQLRQQRAVTEALELVQKAIQDLGNRPGLRELEEQLLADQARTRLARQALDKARYAVEQGQIEAAGKLATELETNLSGEVDTRELRAAIAAKAEELRVRAAIEGFVREAESLRSQGRFDEALQSLDDALQPYRGTQVLIDVRERVEKDRQAALRKQAREQALSEISALPQSVQGAPDESGLREIVARAETVAAGYPGDKQFKQAAQAVNKAAKRRRIEFRQLPGATTAPPVAAPLGKRPIAVVGIAAGVLIGAAGIWWLAGSRSVALQISTDPPGAKVTVGSMSCTTPQCALRLAPGNYDIRAEKPGYRAGSTTATIGKSAPAPVAFTLVPLPARLSVGANFTKATIAFDGSQLGQLRNGEFALDSVPEGTHSLDIHSSDGQAALRFEYKAGQPPKILAPPSGAQIQAVVVSGYASTAEVQCDCASGEVTVDGKSAGQLQNHRLALTSLASGTHQLRVSAPDGIRESVVSLQDSPSINLYVAADLDVGTLVVEAGQDGVQVLLDNRPQPTLTHEGIVRIPAPSKQYSVSVAKPGFRSPAAKSIEVKKGQLQRVSFDLLPLESTLEVRAGSPGIRVQIDGQSAGVTRADGSLRVDNVKPGAHTIDLSKDGYTPRSLPNFKFEPGATVTLGPEAQLAALPTPTPTQPNPAAVTPTPTPDPRALEAEEWNRLHDSQDINKFLEFIGKHPGDAYSTQAAARVEQIEWDNLQNNADPKAWEAFANKYPKSDRADPARKRSEQMEWSRVDKQNAGQIRAFLQHHAGNPDAAAALAAAEQAERLAADKRAISQVLTQYQQAFTSKNIDGMLALRPSLKGTPTEKNIREAFHQKQSIVLELTPLREADISGDSAVVQCRQTTQNQQGGDKVPAAVTVTITLRRTGQSWVIKDIH
jgi:serine/threonine-protein kinase